MPSRSVVEGFDVIENGFARFDFRIEDLRTRQQLSFDGSKAALGKGVIIAIAFGAHALMDRLTEFFSE